MSEIESCCLACKGEKSIKAAKVPRFNSLFRLNGYMLLIPSIFGILLSVVLFVASAQIKSDVVRNPYSYYAYSGSGAISVGASIFIGIAAVIGGLVGIFLLTKRKGFQCSICGTVLETE